MVDKVRTLQSLTASLRDMDWLHARRVRAYAIMLLIAYAAMLISPFIDATRGPGSDFLAFWGAAKLAVAGTPQLAYDIASETAVQATTGIAGMFGGGGLSMGTPVDPFAATAQRIQAARDQRRDEEEAAQIKRQALLSGIGAMFA